MDLEALFTEVGSGGYGLVAHPELGGEHPFAGFFDQVVLKRPEPDKKGHIPQEAIDSIAREIQLLHALTNKEGKDTETELGGIVQILGHIGLEGEAALPAYAMAKGNPVEGSLRVDQILQLSLDMSYTLARMHRWGLVHGDVKKKNIVETNGSFKLCDLGMTGIYDPDMLPAHLSALKLLPFKSGGTMRYIAPELMNLLEEDSDDSSSRQSDSYTDSPSRYLVSGAQESSSTVTDDTSGCTPFLSDEELSSCSLRPTIYLELDKHVFPAAEVYSFGVTLYELLDGEAPFVMDETILEQKAAGLERISSIKEGTPEYALQEIAFRCMELDYRQRPTMEQVHSELTQVHVTLRD